MATISYLYQRLILARRQMVVAISIRSVCVCVSSGSTTRSRKLFARARYHQCKNHYRVRCRLSTTIKCNMCTTRICKNVWFLDSNIDVAECAPSSWSAIQPSASTLSINSEHINLLENSEDMIDLRTLLLDLSWECLSTWKRRGRDWYRRANAKRDRYSVYIGRWTQW